MSENLGEFERLLGHAALRLWSELPREEIQRPEEKTDWVRRKLRRHSK